MMLNPLAPMLEGLRLSIVHDHNLLSPLVVDRPAREPSSSWTPWYLAYSAAWAIVMLIGRPAVLPPFRGEVRRVRMRARRG